MLINKVFILFTLLLPQGFCEFYTPQQKGRGVWKVGDVEPVKYKTSYTNYTIALWQQSLTEGSAGLGPIVYRELQIFSLISLCYKARVTNICRTETTNGPGRQFDWLVQTYDFNLDESNVFFFWLFPGDASMQGNQSMASMPSAYFNITREAVSAGPSEAATTSGSSPAATSDPSTPTSTTPQPDSTSSKNSNGLSTASKAGIGVGAGVGILAVIAAAFLLYRRLSHQQQTINELQQRTVQHSQWHPSQGESKYAANGRMHPDSVSAVQGQGRPVELPVELPGWTRG